MFTDDCFTSGESSLLQTAKVSCLGDLREFTLGKEINQLKRLLAEKTQEVDFFKGALQKIEARRQKNDAAGATASTTKSGK